MRNQRRLGTVAAALIGITALAAPAMAATGNGSFAATCDPAAYGYASDGVYYYHATDLASVTVQNLSSRTATERIYSSNGNPVTAYDVASGGSKTWNSVKRGNYLVQAKAAATADCNGILPGKGDFTFADKITY